MRASSALICIINEGKFSNLISGFNNYLIMRQDISCGIHNKKMAEDDTTPCVFDPKTRNKVSLVTNYNK